MLYTYAFIAAAYSTTLEKSAVEFAVAYINQPTVDSLHWLTTLNISAVGSNEITRRKAGELTVYSARAAVNILIIIIN